MPDDIFQVTDLPNPLVKMEAPVKKILMGMSTDTSLSKDAMRNPESLYFKEFKFQILVQLSPFLGSGPLISPSPQVGIHVPLVRLSISGSPS